MERDCKRSIRGNPQQLKDSLEFSIAEKPNFQRALSAGIPQLHLGAKTFPQAIFQTRNMRILRQRNQGDGAASAVRFVRLEPGDKRFSLSHVKAFLNCALGGLGLKLFRAQAKNDLGMPDR